MCLNLQFFQILIKLAVFSPIITHLVSDVLYSIDLNPIAAGFAIELCCTIAPLRLSNQMVLTTHYPK